MNADIIVVGAGPAGSACAYYLAKYGRRVILLDRQSFPRDKSCGDGLTRAAVRTLGEMGLADRLSQIGKRVSGARIFMRGRGNRDFKYPPDPTGVDFGLVVPRFDLDYLLCQQAVTYGAELREKCLVESLLYEDERVVGVKVLHQNRTEELRAKVIVAADGAASRLAHQARPALQADYGYALRAYVENLSSLGDLLEIYAPLTDSTNSYFLPSYGWVFPTGTTTANVGVGLFQREHGANVREMLDRFLQQLVREDPRFEKAQVCGTAKGAPLRFDFQPENCGREGLLLAGDAAGMISPFTGEGISFALESGKLAAEVIENSLVSNAEFVDYREYSRLLGNKYVGYFETGRHAARRYLLVWHVLDATFDNERPLFSLCRQAALFPEGVSEPSAFAILEDVSSCVSHDLVRLRADLFSIGEVLNETVRRDWPFLAKTSIFGGDHRGIPFRPALFLLLTSYLGNASTVQIALSGAAVELGYVAALAQLSVSEEIDENEERRPVNWSNLFAITVADFLLASAYHLGSRAGPNVSQIIAEALCRACEARVHELRNAFKLEMPFKEHLDVITRKTGTLFELPCTLGAILAGLSHEQTQSLTAYGRQVGVAHQLVEDVLELEGQPRSLGLSAVTDSTEGLYGSVLRMALNRRDGVGERLTAMLQSRNGNSAPPRDKILHLIRETGTIEEVMDLARQSVSNAQRELESLPSDKAVLALRQLAEHAVNRAFQGAYCHSFASS